MIGTTLSHYEITAELGRGGMGIVYKARDIKLDREVAIKVLPASALSNEDDRARFYREAKAAASLTHPNIAAVYQIDEAVPEGAPSEEVRPFIAMEYIDGETLDARIKQGPLKLKEAVRIAMQVAGALGAAHKKEVVHRDIKSANIMLTSDGEAKVLDFGLAQTSASTKLTRMGSTLGTVAYMSPEQARGEMVDGRTDLWSLGAVLYEMVAGVNPFGGDYEQAVVYSIMNEAPEPLTAVRTGVPMELERIVNKALSKDVDVRYQSAAGFMADLKGLDLADSKSLHRSQITMSDPAVQSVSSPNQGRSFSMPVAAGLAIVAMILGGLIGAALWGGSGSDADVSTVRRVSTSFDQLQGFDSPTISPDERYLVFSATDSLGVWASYVYDYESGKVVSRYPTAMMMYPDISPDGRWVVLSAIGGDMQTFQLPDGKATVISRQGEWAYWESSESLIFRMNDNLYRMPASGGDATLIAEPDSSAGINRLWPSYVFEDGKKAFVSAGGTGPSNRSIMLLDLESSELKLIQRNAHQAKYLDSGHIMYIQGGGLSGQMVVQPYDKDREELYGLPVRLDTDDISWTSWNVSEDGTVVYSPFVALMGKISWMDTSGFFMTQYELPSDLYDSAVLSPTGDNILVGRDNAANGLYAMEILSLDASRPPRRIAEESTITTSIWSMDGQAVYFADTGQSGTISNIYKVSISGGGRTEQVAKISNTGIGRMSVSPDESFILFGDNLSDEIVRYSLENDEVTSWASDSETRQSWPVISPSGESVVFLEGASLNRGLVVSDAEGNRLWSYRDPTSGLTDPQWSVDGRYLYFKTVSGELLRIAVTSSGEFAVNGNVESIGQIGARSMYSLFPSDDRIMVLSLSESRSESPVSFIFNYGVEAERVAPTR